MIGRQIQRARKNTGISRSKLASLLSVTVQTVYRWEVGQTRIPIKQAIRVSKILPIPLQAKCEQCAQNLTIRDGEIEPAHARDLLGLMSAAYMVTDGLPCASVDDARRITEISNLIEAALDLIESTMFGTFEE